AVNVHSAEQLPKRFYGAEHLGLPTLNKLNVPPAWKNEPPKTIGLDIESLASALRVAAGYQVGAEGTRRIAPNGGGLGIASLYVIARQVRGLEPGIYHYFGYEHKLERIGEVADELLLGALGDTSSSMPPAVVIGTAQMTKLRNKYDNFAFRLSILDAGVTKGCLYEALNALGIPHFDYVGARDKVLAQILRLPVAGHRNTITFAIALGEDKISGLKTHANVNHNLYPDSLIEWSSQLGPTTLPAANSTRVQSLFSVTTDRNLWDVMISRRSTRTFDDRPLDAKTLNLILSLSGSIDESCVNVGGLSLQMTLWVVVAVDGSSLKRGVYRWNHGANQLELRRENFSTELLESTMSQKGFAQAPVTLFIGGNFEQAVTNYGARGYREMLNRAGTMMLRAQLVAEALGLSGCMWGGITEEACGELLNIDRYRDCPLFGGSLGYPENV
ncbi:MAG TPA: nitroreductase family protein, partial [Cellvibrio sp.]